MSDLIDKYDIGGVLDRFEERYGINYLKSDRYPGRLEDYMDQDDPDRAVMIAFRDELENGDRKRLESEAFNRELMDAMYEDQTIDGLSDIMGIDRDQMKKYFMTHKMMNFHRKNMRDKANQVVVLENHSHLSYLRSDKAVAQKLGLSLEEVRNVLSQRHQPPRLIHGVLIKRRLWYEADGGFD